MKRMASEWTTYRTRFLITAKQLDQPLSFVDALGREHSGQPGDYLVQSSDGSLRIAPQEIFEDIYVPMGRARQPLPSLVERLANPSSTQSSSRRRASSNTGPWVA